MPMTFDEYQTVSRQTAIYPNLGSNFIYPTLGLVGESGEVAEKIKKVLRAGQTTLTDEQRTAVAKELGDVLWYVANLATELGLSFEEIAQGNITKLSSRQERGQLHGSGDER